MCGTMNPYRVLGPDHHPHPMILGELFQAEQGANRSHAGNRTASVVLGAAPSKTWAQQAGTIERAIASVRTK